MNIGKTKKVREKVQEPKPATTITPRKADEPVKEPVPVRVRGR